MPYFIDLDKQSVIVKAPGRLADVGEVLIDQEVAVACGLIAGQQLTNEQVQALRDGSVEAFKRELPSLAASAPDPSGRTSEASSGWHRDPMKRHELRFWDGSAWTGEVSDKGVRSIDPLMLYFVNLTEMKVVVKPPGSLADEGEIAVDSKTAVSCELHHGQILTSHQLQVVRGGAEVFARIDGPEVARSNSDVWVTVTSVLAILAWVAAAFSSVAQKLAADSQISGNFDISAIQVQQLNGSVTAHVLVALVIAIAATVPLLIAVSARIVALLKTHAAARSEGLARGGT